MTTDIKINLIHHTRPNSRKRTTIGISNSAASGALRAQAKHTFIPARPKPTLEPKTHPVTVRDEWEIRTGLKPIQNECRHGNPC